MEQSALTAKIAGLLFLVEMITLLRIHMYLFFKIEVSAAG